MKHNCIIKLFLLVFSLTLGSLGLYAGSTENLQKAEIVVDTLDNFFIQDASSLPWDNVECFITVDNDGTPAIVIYEKGLKHKESVLHGDNYHDKYRLNDNVELMGYSFQIKDIDLQNARVTIGECYYLIDIFLDLKYYDPSKYFKGKSYLFIYDWAQYNNESVELLPTIRDLYTKYGKYVSFLGVCYGNPSDKKESERIWKNNKMGFKMLFIDKASLTEDLPSFILTSDPWLVTHVAGKEYLPLVVNDLEYARLRSSKEDEEE